MKTVLRNLENCKYFQPEIPYVTGMRKMAITLENKLTDVIVKTLNHHITLVKAAPIK
ncbi:MAG: hypothetical protein ACQXXF_01455 [Thermoplasmatota archaeon]|jgi:hypothetical protein